MKNLWPSEINIEHQTTPKEFLTAQSGFISTSTNGKLTGEVSSFKTNATTAYTVAEDLTGDVFIHSLTITAPVLKYSLRILSIAHLTLKIFPVSVYSNLEDKKYTVNNISELETQIGVIFKSQSVIEPLQALILQSSSDDDF